LVVTVGSVRLQQMDVISGTGVIAVMPAELGDTNAGRIREDLLRILNSGVDALVIDMSATTFCPPANPRTLKVGLRRTRWSPDPRGYG
jgi:hypothetical protein